MNIIISNQQANIYMAITNLQFCYFSHYYVQLQYNAP